MRLPEGDGFNPQNEVLDACLALINQTSSVNSGSEPTLHIATVRLSKTLRTSRARTVDRYSTQPECRKCICKAGPILTLEEMSAMPPDCLAKPQTIAKPDISAHAFFLGHQEKLHQTLEDFF